MKTFKEWRELGFAVRKGQHATDGKFSRAQVAYLKPKIHKMTTDTFIALKALASLHVAIKPEDKDDSVILSSANGIQQMLGSEGTTLITVGHVRAALRELERVR